MAMDPKVKTLTRCVGVVVLMGGLAWASVPFYDWFCRVTGFGGVTGTADAGSEEILDQTIKVRFDASRERGMPWDFKPEVREMELRIGETGLAFYEAYNQRTALSPDRPATTSRPTRRAGSSTRSIASVFRNRFCSRANG